MVEAVELVYLIFLSDQHSQSAAGAEAGNDSQKKDPRGNDFIETRSLGKPKHRQNHS